MSVNDYDRSGERTMENKKFEKIDIFMVFINYTTTRFWKIIVNNKYIILSRKEEYIMSIINMERFGT